MVAIDTNVLVRLLVIDDPAQCARARALVEGAPVRILRTVLLEAEWVLRARIGVERDRIQAFFLGLLDTGNIEFEDEATVRDAVDLHRRGFDFADALHLTAAGPDGLVSFDEKLVKRARRQKRAARLP